MSACPTKKKKNQWFIYLVRCADGSLYTGIALDISRRLAEHSKGRGSKYLRSRLPIQLVYQEGVSSRSLALRREAAIKRLSREEKLALVL